MGALERIEANEVDVELAPPPPPLPAQALERLPGDVGTDPYWRVVGAFLIGYQAGHTARAYFADLNAWWIFCAGEGMHPFTTRRHHVDLWVRQLRQPQPTTGKPAAAASIARRLSCLSKFYDYAIKDAEVVEYSPIANVRRPKVSDDSAAVGLSTEELRKLLVAAEAHDPRSAALVGLLTYNGLRIAEALGCDVDDLTYDRGHRMLRIVRKGEKPSTEVLSPMALRAIEDYVGDRTSGPLFLNAEGTDRLSYSTAQKLVRRLARKARIPAAEKITPHSLRHSFATALLDEGVALQFVQDAMGHADPRTTRRYDRARKNPDRHPTYRMAEILSRRSPEAIDDQETA